MKERILEFLNNQNKTSSQLAEEIGVEPSGISHIMSGRNKPSLDFVLKMLNRYPYISAEWLLFGRGNMFTSPAEPSLFDTEDKKAVADIENKISSGIKADDKFSSEKKPNDSEIINKPGEMQTATPKSGLKRIIWFYEDGSFSEFFPRNS